MSFIDVMQGIPSIAPMSTGPTAPAPVGPSSSSASGAPVLRRGPHHEALRDAGAQALGHVARGRPPSPFIGLGTVMAGWWVVFGAVVVRHLVW
jgi:hypothetical protein